MLTCYLGLLLFLDGELCLPTEHEPSMFDLGSNEGAVPVGGFIYRGCQSRRLYGSYVFGDKNGYVVLLYDVMLELLTMQNYANCLVYPLNIVMLPKKRY